MVLCCCNVDIRRSLPAEGCRKINKEEVRVGVGERAARARLREGGRGRRAGAPGARAPRRPPLAFASYVGIHYHNVLTYDSFLSLNIILQ